MGSVTVSLRVFPGRFQYQDRDPVMPRRGQFGEDMRNQLKMKD